ncbi:MAG: Stk1 family PASTA domain-containing Ser/Thr kinase [Bacillota bacterium]|nr:Stk1 family PASTA domain-containing Ser/Thr kinase [Bacillota bacterium]
MSSKALAGRYELLEKIGEGGMSVVYKARCRILKRFVAIKILKPEFIKDNKFTESFRREAQAAAGLTHPNIVNIYDVGREGNIYYIVMELIEGRVLSDIIKEEGPMEYHRVIEITKQIASALGFAHKNNIIHRDVKPHNILITGTGIAKIADFGIAKAVNTSTIVDNSAEGVMGSVHYFSPEQARGGYVDERSDIYSLGIVMYEMLTGRVPFDAENPVSVALMHINDEMVPPSQLVPGIPLGLELIILKATDKYQENRYASAEELIDDLDNIELVTRVVGAPVKKTEEASEERQIRKQEEELPEKKEKKSKKKLIIAIVIAAAVVAGLIGVGFATGFLGSAKVPDLIDKTYEEAVQIAEDAGYKIQQGEEVTDPDIEKGHVASQTPEPGEKAKEGTTITVYISKGPGPATVPSVIGMNTKEAQKKLEAAGFELGNVTPVASKKPKGEIVGQDPGAGETAEGGTAVNVKISDGSRENEVSMPFVLDKTLEEAKSIIESAGLQVGKIDEGYSEDYAEGKVMWQQYDAHEKLQKGDTVDLKVSKGPEEKDETGEIDLYIDFSKAENDSFFLTVTVTDSDGTRNIVSGEQKAKSDGGETVTVSGKGKGKVIVLFDTEEVMRKSVDFSTGAVN